jgi:hypothetical protein
MDNARGPCDLACDLSDAEGVYHTMKELDLRDARTRQLRANEGLGLRPAEAEYAPAQIRFGVCPCARRYHDDAVFVVVAATDAEAALASGPDDEK